MAFGGLTKLARSVLRHIRVASKDKKPIQQPKRNRRNNEQVYRRDGISMIAKEGLPALRRWPPSLCHVFCNGRLADIDAKLEQFAMNPWRSRQRIGNAHLANVHGRLSPASPHDRDFQRQ